MKKSTKCVHVGTQNDINGGTVSPISPSTAYNYRNVDTFRYPRYFNVPNHKAVEQKLAALEHAETAILFSSGMSATMTVLLSLLQKGDHIVLQKDIYGGTHDSVKTELKRFGIKVSFSASDITSFEDSIQDNTKVLFIESPSNPILGITDLTAINTLCQSKNIVSIIDNTFASPINQTPHDFGIDIVIHSATKYLGGHSDISAGIATMSESYKVTVRETALHLGGNLDTQASWLLERSLKTLFIRVRQQSSNAQRIAEYLEKHEKISRINYPGLESHPQHQLAKSQMSGFGGMMSFEVLGNPDDFLNNLKIISPAMSLGGVDSTITSPCKTSHARISKEERLELGISDNLLRMSTGIEDPDDLIDDLKHALAMLP